MGADQLPRLLTASYREAIPAMRAGAPLLLVRTSLGKPKWEPVLADEMPYVEEIAPDPWFINAPGDQFRRRYRHKLHRTGVRRIDARFTELLDQHPGKSLVLLCFEADPVECHRAMFARWWMEKTGEAIYELGIDTAPVAFADPGYVEQTA